MKTVVSFLAVTAAVVFSLHAHDLDTSVSNEFWCCWLRENPVVNERSEILQTEFSSFVYTERAGVLDRLLTLPWGLSVVIR